MTEVLKARWVLPMRPWRILEQGAVAMDGGRILQVGTAAEVVGAHPRATVVDLPDHVLMPGLVNAHTHAAMTLLRGFADDVPLMTWLRDRIWPAEGHWVDADFVADGTRLAAAEMLSGGVTCFSDMYFFPAQAIEAAQSAGIRILAGQVVVDSATAYTRDAADHLAKARLVIEQFRDTPTVHLAMAPHAPYTVSDEVFTRIAEYCQEYNLPLHTHIHETRDEVEQGVAQYGVRPLARLDRLGIVNRRLIGAHAVHLTDEEIALLAERDVALIHCPVSNLKLASGIARLTDWLARGLRVGLGTDGVASNNRLDVLADMRLASLLAKGTSGDAAAVPAHQALRAATVGGAAALGLDDEIGAIGPGMAADLIAIDMSRAALAPMYDVASHLVNCAERHDVSDVWVAGRRLKDSGALTGEDPEALRATAARWRDRIGSAAG